ARALRRLVRRARRRPRRRLGADRREAPVKRRDLPTFIAPPADGGAARPLPRRGIAIVVALALLLCVQVVLADRERLAADARWRPVVAGACAIQIGRAAW